MDSALLSLLGAFLLSIIGLFAFIWSMRQGLLVENPKAASVIFADGEVGRVDDPAAAARAHNALHARSRGGKAPLLVDAGEIEDRVAADRSSAFPVFSDAVRSACSSGMSARTTTSLVDRGPLRKGWFALLNHAPRRWTDLARNSDLSMTSPRRNTVTLLPMLISDITVNEPIVVER